jgi:hypothetical protein
MSQPALGIGLGEDNCAFSAALGFGSDKRLYYRFQLANGFDLAGGSSMAGTVTEILCPNTNYPHASP